MELLQPSSTEQATGALGNGSRALAGGTELVPLLRRLHPAAEQNIARLADERPRLPRAPVRTPGGPGRSRGLLFFRSAGGF